MTNLVTHKPLKPITNQWRDQHNLASMVRSDPHHMTKRQSLLRQITDSNSQQSLFTIRSRDATLAAQIPALGNVTCSVRDLKTSYIMNRRVSAISEWAHRNVIAGSVARDHRTPSASLHHFGLDKPLGEETYVTHSSQLDESITKCIVTWRLQYLSSYTVNGLNINPGLQEYKSELCAYESTQVSSGETRQS